MALSFRSLPFPELLKNATAAGINQLLNFLPLLLTPILAKRLGLEVFGVVAVALSLIQLSFVITDFGYTLSTTHKISKNKLSRTYINTIISSVLLGKLPLTLIAISATLSFPFIVPSYFDYWQIFTLAALAIIGQSYQMNWLFLGLEQMKVITAHSIITKIPYALFVLLFVHAPQDAYLVLAGWGVAQSVAAFLSLRKTLQIGYRIEGLSLAQTVAEMKEASPFFASRLAVATYTSASTVIVGVLGQQQAACFFACQQIYKIGSALPVNQVLYPFMAKSHNWSVFYCVVFACGGLLVASGATGALFSNDIILAIFDGDFEDARIILEIFIIATIVSYFAVCFGYPALCVFDALDRANLSVIISALINALILLLLYVGDALTAVNVALSILITEACVLCLRISFLMQAKSNVHLSQKNI